MMDEFMTIQEVANLLKVHPGSVYRWVNEGKLPCKRLGGENGQLRITRDDLQEFMTPRVPSDKAASAM